MSDFQTMDDFAVFVNDYLTPDQLSVQAYSYASASMLCSAVQCYPLTGAS